MRGGRAASGRFSGADNRRLSHSLSTSSVAGVIGVLCTLRARAIGTSWVCALVIGSG